MKSLAFIPARGGSKRLPGKNVKLFCGKPLIYYSIAFARHNRFDRIIVSTDDQEIALIAERFGAQILMRPDYLSGDSASTASAAKHCLEAVQSAGFTPGI